MYLLRFNPPTFLQVIKTTFEVPVPVMHSKTQHPRMDEIERHPTKEAAPGFSASATKKLQFGGRAEGKIAERSVHNLKGPKTCWGRFLTAGPFILVPRLLILAGFDGDLQQ